MSTTCYVRKADGTLLGPMQRDAVEMMKAAGMLPDDCCILDEKPQEKASSFSRLLACVHQDDIAGFIALLKEGVSPAEKGPDGFSIAELVRNENKTLFINCLDLLNLRHEQKEPAPVCAVAPKVSVADCSRIISDKQKELIQCTEQCLSDADFTQEMKIRQLTEELLACGWNVNSELSNPGDPTTFMIFHVALKMCNISFVDRLLQSGAKVTPHPDGTYVVNPLECIYTPEPYEGKPKRDLIRMSFSNELDLAKKLIAHGAILEDSYALGLVSSKEHPAPELLKLLLELPSVKKDGDKFNFSVYESHYSIAKMTREAAGMLAARGWNQTCMLLQAVRRGWEDLVRAFIANGADVNARVLEYQSHTSPLQEAVSAGHIEVVKILLQNGADWTAVDAEWREQWFKLRASLYPDVKQYLIEFTSKGLFQAIEEDDAATFERLINSGADVYVLNERGENTLQVAQRLKNKRIERMIRMICEAERRPMESGITRPLVERTAVAQLLDILQYGKPGNEENCLSLIDRVDSVECLQRSVLRAAAEKNYVILIKKLIDKSQKQLNSITDGYREVWFGFLESEATAVLFEAARSGNVKVCQCLLERMTFDTSAIAIALDHSIAYGYPQVFRCLWENARGDIREVEKLISLAIEVNEPEILDILMGYRSWPNINLLPDCYIYSGILRILLSRRVNLPINELCFFNEIGKSERLPLCIAADEGDDECVRLLLDAGAKVALRGVMGRTALHYAAYRASARKVQDLIHAGAEVNVEDERGYTPLHLAALVGDEACTRLLLEAGAHANAKTLDGFTALHFAANQGRADIAELLLRHGAERNPVNGLGISALSLAEKAGYDALVRLMA